MDELRRYRVLPGPEADTLRFLDRESYEPSVVATDDTDESVADPPTESEDKSRDDSDGEPAVADIRPGYLVDAALDWSTARPAVRSLAVVRPTLYAFADGVEPMFEAARETWQAAQAAGDGMNVQVVRNTDNEPIGVVYVFAESGDRGRLEEFREGARPLEPLVDRVNEDDAAPREVFVLRPADGGFTTVAIALRKAGQLADTMRDTYDLPRPAEPAE